MSNPSEHPTVFAIDDEPAVLSWIKALLEAVRQPVETFSSARDFLERITPERPGCLILDVRMPGMTGLELQEELLRREIRLPVIFLSAHGDIPMALKAVRNGAFDFIEKPVRDNFLLDRVQLALRQDQLRREQIAARERIQGRLSLLTGREREVLRRVVEGMPNKTIAAELQISEKTVEYRRNRIMTKLEVNSVAQVVQIALQLGLKD